MIFQILFDLWIYSSFGGKSLTYLLLGTYLALGIHPISGHFISEHYMFCKVETFKVKKSISYSQIIQGVDTYSYYGSLNLLTFNVGYHNEHHDFPYVSSSALPMLSKIAPEFYNELPQVFNYFMNEKLLTTLIQLKSWVVTLFDFVFNPEIGPYARCVRNYDSRGHVVKTNSAGKTVDYTDEDARLGQNGGYSKQAQNFVQTDNIIIKKYHHFGN